MKESQIKNKNSIIQTIFSTISKEKVKIKENHFLVIRIFEFDFFWIKKKRKKDV